MKTKFRLAKFRVALALSGVVAFHVLPAHAQKFHSAPGARDGLHWPFDVDGTISPLGPFMAEALKEDDRDKTWEVSPD